MERRKFLEKGLQAALFAGVTPVFLQSFYGQQAYGNPFLPYDLAAVMGGQPEAMFDQAIAALGGMKNFVSPNQTVVVKPNIGWDAGPERAANTNPKLVKRIIEHCFEAGAKEVYVFDNTCDNWVKSYENSGIKRAAQEAKAKVVTGNAESYYQNVTVKHGKSLQATKVHELILSSDVFINVPILKHHSSAKLTIAMKNLMGVVWDRRYWHSNNLHQCIADYATFRKPDLNVVDAFNIMKQNGPRGVSTADVLNLKSLLISPDMVAIDAAAAKIFGHEPEDIPYINMADQLGVGRKDLSSLNIKRIKM